MGHPVTLVGFMEMYPTQGRVPAGRFSSSAGGKGSAVRAALTRWCRYVRGRGLYELEARADMEQDIAALSINTPDSDVQSPASSDPRR